MAHNSGADDCVRVMGCNHSASSLYKSHYAHRAVLYLFIYTNKISLYKYFTLLKQHIKIVVLFKSPYNCSTCFGQFLTILRETVIFFTSVTKDKLFRFMEACLLYLLCFVLMLLRALPSLVVVQYSNNQAREGTQQLQHKAQQV